MILREVITFYENLYSSKDAELIVDLKHVLSKADIKLKSGRIQFYLTEF